MNAFFALISRMKNIDRWALMRNSDRENVREHSHMVAVIAHALSVIRRDVFGLPADPGAAAVAALFHDATEIITGDMPTPVKYSNTEIRAAYKSIEKNAAERLVSQLTQEMRPAYTSLLAGEYGELGAIIKAADKISAYIKCLEEQKTGNSEFRLAAVQTKAKIDAMCLPEADYFMQHYIPAFSLTLDELEN